MSRARSPTRQCTAGIGKSPSRSVWLMRTSAQLSTLAVDDQEGLERADARHGLERAVFAEQRRGATAVDAEHRPVRLLAEIGARVRGRAETPWRARRRRRWHRRGPQLELGQRHDLASRLVDLDANEARFGIGQPVRLQVAARAVDAADVAPVLAIVGEVDGIARRCRAASPAQREHAELARHAVVDRQHRRRSARSAGCQSVSAAVDGVRSVVTRQRGVAVAVGAGCGALAGNSRSSSRSKQTLPLPAPLPRRDHELDRLRCAAACGRPSAPRRTRSRAGETSGSASRAERGTRVVAAPPDVGAGRIDELHLQRVRRRIAAHVSARARSAPETRSAAAPRPRRSR